MCWMLFPASMMRVDVLRLFFVFIIIYHLRLPMYMLVFLLVITELFSLGVTAEALRAKIDRKSAISLQRGQFDPKLQVEGVTHTNHYCTDS